MAKVNVSVAPPVPVEKFYKIELILDRKEAEALCALTGSITGSSKNSFRGVTESIFYKLQGLGVNSSRVLDSGSLFFEDYEKDK
jgi:hypothetical protein